MRIADPLPGSYVVTIKGKSASGTHFVRLALYSFQDDVGHTARQDFWYWTHDSRYTYGDTSRRIGFVQQPGYSRNDDQLQFLQGPTRSGPPDSPWNFHGSETSKLTMYGTWARDGNHVSVTWTGGERETWELTWGDSTLQKMELTEADYVDGRCFLERIGSALVRERFVANVGWGFGAPGTGFESGKTVGQCAQKNYSGLLLRHNVWYNPPRDEPVTYDEMDLRDFFQTDQGTLRLVFPDVASGLNVFAYFANPANNPGLLARRVMYQISHDWNQNGHIADDVGHTYCGLQIIDGTDTVRGFVFADVSPGNQSGTVHTISAMYYLETASATDEERYGTAY